GKLELPRLQGTRLDAPRKCRRTGCLDTPEQRRVRLETELGCDPGQSPRFGNSAVEFEAAARGHTVRLDCRTGIQALGQAKREVQGDEPRRCRLRVRVEDDLYAAGGKIAKTLDIAADPGAPALALENRIETGQGELPLGEAQRCRSLAAIAEPLGHGHLRYDRRDVG